MREIISQLLASTTRAAQQPIRRLGLSTTRTFDQLLKRFSTRPLLTVICCLPITFSCVSTPSGELDTKLTSVSSAPTTLAATAAIDATVSACDADVYHNFDFWLGEWEVHTADGTRAGGNSISAQQRHCLLLEEWIGQSGTGGTSINYYDADEKKWTQQWISPGTQITIKGNLRGQSMVLEGFIFYTQNNRKAEFRGTWTPLSDGRVRQFFEEKNDEGKWTTWFEGFYSKI